MVMKPKKYKKDALLYFKSLSKVKKATNLILLLFISGIIITSIGLIKGEDIASSLSRPNGANIWSTSSQMISGCTFIPMIVGISLVILSLIFSVIVFNNWIKGED